MTTNYSQIRYPRARIDNLTDGIYSVAMTLLVLDIRLPDNFHPTDAAQLIDGLLGMWPKVLPYVLSFLVLGLRWLAGVQLRTKADLLDASYIRWWLLQLLLITCVPFTAILVGRFASFAPAIWLYGGNTALIAIVSWRILKLTPEVENEHHIHGRELSLLLLLASAVLCIAWSFVSPPQAPWALLLNLISPMLIRHPAVSKKTVAP
jgi:uncharacterized membrane protein